MYDNQRHDVLWDPRESSDREKGPGLQFWGAPTSGGLTAEE